MIRLTELMEGSFGKSGKVTHVMDVPMFSIYVPTVKHVPQKLLQMHFGDKIARECNKARNEIHKVGFPSMHANIIIRDLSKEPNPNTGETGVAGLAHHYKKYMEIDIRYFTSDVIVHEWAHLWMMNNSKKFKKAIKVLYRDLMKKAGAKIDTSKEIDKPLPYEEDLKLINVWGAGFEKMFSYMMFDRAANAYILKNKRMTPDLFPRLPHLMDFSAKLKRPIVASSLHGNTQTFQAGEEVNVIKGNSGWLIGKEINNSRYEILTKTYDELSDYVESNKSGNLLTDIEMALENQLERYRKYNTPKYLESKLNEEIQNGLVRILEDISKEFKARPTKEEVAVVKSWSQYILPKYLEILRSRKQLAYFQANPKKVYDALWVGNGYKPVDLSFGKFFTKIVNRSKAELYQKDFMDKPSFVGKDFSEHRTTMAQLNNWANSYGMSNEDELWATAIESFFKLPLTYRKLLIKIMMYDTDKLTESIINESVASGKLDRDFSEIYSEMQDEFHSGQKYQTWKLVPARDVLLVWAKFAKYGRVDEDKLDKIWEIVKENVIKIGINTDVWQGSDPDFFYKDSYDDITREEWDRHCLFVADRSNSKWIRNSGEVEGNARYSDCYKALFKLLEKAYGSASYEELLVNIDTILNFVHGLGNMAKWFVEGGVNTLDKMRDFQAKGIHLTGKLSESFVKGFEANRIGRENWVEIFKNPTQSEINACMSGEDELGVILLDRDAYTWNRGKALHVEVMRQLGKNMNDMLPLLVNLQGRNCAIYVTDAAVHTKWYRQPETLPYIKQHPFFKFKTIEDISFWDEDVNGKWVEESLNEAKNPRLGLCYELSGRYVSQHHDAVLVHGRLTNPFSKGHPELDHAWVEEGDEIFDPVMDKKWPKDAYEGLFKAKVYKKYTFEEVLKLILRHEHWGPWDDTEIKTEGRETERGKPLSQTGYQHKYVEIFRAMLAKNKELVENDYVTRSKKFAIEHSDHMTSVHEELYHVMRFVVEAEFVFEAHNPGEYFYNGPSVKGTEVYNSRRFL